MVVGRAAAAEDVQRFSTAVGDGVGCAWLDEHCVAWPDRKLFLTQGYVKTRYKGLAKNAAQIKTLFALSNLWMARRALMQMQASGA